MAESTEKDMKRLSSPRFGITSNVVMWQLQVASGLESLKIFSSALANGKQQEMHSLKKISFRRTQMMCPYTLKIGSIMRLSIFCSGEEQHVCQSRERRMGALKGSNRRIRIREKTKAGGTCCLLSERMRTIKLPDLLIEVDNDLHFTNAFLPAAKRNGRNSNDICNTLTTIMAYGCNIGPHIMAQMITGISYQKIKDMFDWQLTEDAHRIALADVVNDIGSIEITKAWGDGKTAEADGQRFGYRRKTLQRTFSHKFNDFAIEFYIFVADNYAPFYNLVKEATDRDSSKVLDGYLYNVSDLDPDEWYYDTHGYN